MNPFLSAKRFGKNYFQRVSFFMGLSLFFVQAGLMAAISEDASPVWGINAVALKPQSVNPISTEELLTNQANAVSLGRFYRVGSKNLTATPTGCFVTYDRDCLNVVFRCSEDDLADPAIRHNVDWYSLRATPVEQDSAFPDKVDLFVQPDMNQLDYYQFTMTLDGLKFGCQHGAHKSKSSIPTSGRVNAFTAVEIRKEKEWIVLFQIPWKTLGGKPQDYFGILPMRTRWRDGEVSCPAAVDFGEEPPADLFIETHFSGKTRFQTNSANLCQLPSGVLRWQKPAALTYPDSQTLRQIWQMQQSLSERTDENNFSQRIRLTQQWIDLLTWEGFNFRPGSGSIVKEDLTPATIRREINLALRKNEIQRAYQLLDVYLSKLDKVSAKWFADGSPGDILEQEWRPISKLKSVQLEDNVLTMHGLTGERAIALHLSLPETGGVRLYGNDEGYFKPASLLPLKMIQTSNLCSVNVSNGGIDISLAPFAISFRDRTGRVIERIDSNDIAFRFSPAGQILAVDFRSYLDANEVIYGFGERYDHFNEHGRVFTLWGMDDWLGNTAGLMNETYKPIPVYHGSSGYMVFDNSTYRLRADIGKTVSNQCRLTQQGSIFDYYFLIGSPEEAIQSYTELTGKPVLPPKWAFEPWMGRTGRGWNQPAHNPVAEEESVVEQFAKLDIPHSAIYAEGSSADSTTLNEFMAARGIKVLSWYYPAISQANQASLMPELKADKLPLLNAGNKTASQELSYVDFTDPNARELSRRWWKHRLEIGVAGSMVDFGDRVPEDAVFHNGKRGDEMHNFYAYDYHQTYSEVFRGKRGDDFILIGRAAAPGTQKFVAQFAGDHPANFAGLQAVFTGALNLCACGFSIWGSDLGGFLGWPEPAVYMRWTQFACFSPLMRCHGRMPREPWNYGDAAVANYKYFAWVRENLLDYIYDVAIYSHKTGIPMLRSMAIAYPDEPSLAAVKDEYMFGGDLLVAPVVTGINLKTVSLPSGKCTSLWTGKVISGETNFTSYTPLNTIPVYLKQGAIIPIESSKDLQLGESMTSGKVKAVIVTPPVKEQNFYADGERQETIKLQPEPNGFTVELKNTSEVSCLLVYGITDADAVRINGKILPRLPEDDFDSTAVGWRNDSTINRLIIRLPSRQISPSDLLMQIEVKLHVKDAR